jgi:hypothetical protein
MAGLRLITAIATLGVALTPALAGMPPKKYDHPYSGTLEKHLVPYGQAWEKCNAVSIARGEGGWPKSSMQIGKRSLYGCAMGGKLAGEKRCVIVYSFDPTGNDRKMKSNTFRHERGHCNGWPSHHPDALP